MALNAEQVQALQDAQPPTDWSKFDQGLTFMSPGQLQWPGPGDDKLHVRFFTKPRIDPTESQKLNRPVYKDVPYIEIMMPGEKNVIIVEPVWDIHLKRFPQQWAMFQAGEKEQVVGTPLKVAPFLTEAQIEELAYFKIRTIEQLADLADSTLSNFHGAQQLKTAARAFLDRTTSNEALMERIKALEAENRKLQAAYGDVGKVPPQHQGRK